MSQDTLPKIIAIVGPTASGKSELACTLAQQVEGELICTDSMQVYRKFDIGTAKPTLAERKLVPHHQIDLIEPDGHYSAGNYARETHELILRLEQLGKVPILVGGTGLYYRALIYGMAEIPTISAATKKKVQDQFQKEGLPECYRQLQKLDPMSDQQLHAHDTARILRALEVYWQTGQSITAFQQQHPFTHPQYALFSVGYADQRTTLYQRIEQRTHLMLQAGWIEEVAGLLQQYPAHLKPFQAIGYRQIVEFLQHDLERDAMIQKIQQKSRNYAKRQLTWFRKEPTIRWYARGQEARIIQEIKVFLEKS